MRDTSVILDEIREFVFSQTGSDHELKLMDIKATSPSKTCNLCFSKTRYTIKITFPNGRLRWLPVCFDCFYVAEVLILLEFKHAHLP